MLIDTGCLQTNVVSERIATLIRQDGGKLRPANLVLTSGVGGVSYAVQGSINMTVALPIPHETVKYRHIFVDSIVCREVTSDLIIGLPSITYYRLLALKSLVIQCPKLYFLDPALPIILYTDASDYAHGAYLCQVQAQPDGSSLEQPIRFLSGTFAGAQTRWSTIEKEAYAIYWALKKVG